MWNCHCRPRNRMMVAMPISSVDITDSLTISAGETLVAAAGLILWGSAA